MIVVTRSQEETERLADWTDETHHWAFAHGTPCIDIHVDLRVDIIIDVLIDQPLDTYLGGTFVAARVHLSGLCGLALLLSPRDLTATQRTAYQWT